MASHHYPDPNSRKSPERPAASGSSLPAAADAADAGPASGTDEKAGTPAVDPAELQARLEKRDDVFGSPMVQRRHQTALIVKKVELSPGERAAMGSGGTGGLGWASVFIVLLVLGSAIGVYWWLSPPPVEPAPRPLVVVDDPEPAPAASPAIKPTVTPPRPPAFPPLVLTFAGATGAEQINAALVAAEGRLIENGILIEPARPDLATTWFKGAFPGDVDVEWLVAVDALTEEGLEPEMAREFRVVFGDRLNNAIHVQICVPSRLGHNYGDVLDDTGAVTASYGHNRYGWPFETGVFYRVKIVRRGEKWVVSRDGEVIFSFFRPAADCLQLGYVAVTGARIQSVQVHAK